jgi:hypothetical protein
MQQSDLEFNLCHVFRQLVQVGLDPNDPAAVARVKRMHSGLSPSDPSSNLGPSLTVSHLRHVFSFLKVNLSDSELEELLAMMDDNGDGRVSEIDFMHSMKIHHDVSSANGSTPFDSRYAVNMPWAALDAPSRDNVLTEEDFRAARDALGPLFNVNNDSEINMVVRAMQQAGAQHERHASSSNSGGGGDGGTAVSTPTATPHSPMLSSTRRLAAREVDKESFRRVVSALAAPSADLLPLSSPSSTTRSLAHHHHASSSSSSSGAPFAPSPSHHPHTTATITPAQMHPGAYLDEASPPSLMGMSLGMGVMSMSGGGGGGGDRSHHSSRSSLNIGLHHVSGMGMGGGGGMTSPSTLPPSMFAPAAMSTALPTLNEGEAFDLSSPDSPAAARGTTTGGFKPPSLALSSPSSANASSTTTTGSGNSSSGLHIIPHPPHTARPPAASRKSNILAGSQTTTHRATAAGGGSAATTARRQQQPLSGRLKT